MADTSHSWLFVHKCGSIRAAEVHYPRCLLARAAFSRPAVFSTYGQNGMTGRIAVSMSHEPQAIPGWLFAAPVCGWTASLFSTPLFAILPMMLRIEIKPSAA